MEEIKLKNLQYRGTPLVADSIRKEKLDISSILIVHKRQLRTR